jgi:hypothetical protein
MIYVVEFPVEGRARAWFAFNSEDFILKVRAVRARDGWVIFEARSGRERLTALGTSPEAPDAPRMHTDVFALAAAHGWETPLYRADYLLGRGVLQAAPVDEFQACVAALAQDLKTCRIYLHDEDAIAALLREPLLDPTDNFYAHMALREQLIAMEAMEEDI